MVNDLNWNFIKSNILRFNQNVKNKSLGGGIIRYWCSELYCFARFGCSPDDYFRYQFYKKSNLERNKFITYRRSQQIIKKYNKTEYISYLSNKVEFNKFFKDYIHRDWLDLRETDENTFREFLIKHREVLLKPLNGGQGKGIFKLSLEDYCKERFPDYKEYIAEELLRQHSQMASLNPTSVNTVRVLTFKGKIVACAMRIGGEGAIVDNLHSNGVCAHLDLETGIVDSPCINNHYDYFLFHPSSKVQLVGFKVPNWETVKAEVVKAAKSIPQIAYIGWDVAVLENGVALIEGNHDPGHDVVQMIAQTGLYQTLIEIVHC